MTQGDFLPKILDTKRRRLADAKAARPLEDVREAAFRAREGRAAHALRKAVSDDSRVHIIAEFKRASPSKGSLNEDAEPGETARAYERGGASALSVLTEQDYFRGSLADLAQVKTAARLPVLRKDFVFEEYQVYESAAAGADALLLIVAALDDERLAALRRLAEEELGLDALVEVHTAEEMRRADDAGALLVGVNNRNLHTFHVALETSEELSRTAPARALLVSESGIRDAADIARLRAHGFAAFLVGETLMRAGRPEEALRELLKS